MEDGCLICMKTTSQGHVAMVQWVHEHNCALSDSGCTHPTKGSGLSLDRADMLRAASGDTLEILQCARQPQPHLETSGAEVYL